MKTRLLLVSLLSVAISMTFTTKANAADSLSWYNTYSATDGDILTGTKRLIVRSDTAGYIAKWCVYLDGNPLTGRQYDDDYRPIGLTRSVYWSSRMWGSTEAGSPTTPGCWIFSSNLATTGFDISLDTSTWANGSHTIKIEATPSTGTVHSKTVNVTTTNTLPSVEWVTQSGQTISDLGQATIKIRPGGVPRIVKACLSRDGTAVSASDNFSFQGDTSYGNYAFNPGPDGNFGTFTGGCAVFNDFQNNQAPVGLHQITNLTISVPSVRWADQPTTLTFSIVDAADRIFSAPISFNVLNSRPKMAFTGLSNSTIWENVELNHTFSRSGSALNRICISGSALTDRNVAFEYNSMGTTMTAVPINGCSNTATLLSAIESQTVKIKFNTHLMSNGSHTVTLTSTDVLGKSDTSTHSFTVNNGLPTVKISSPAAGAQLNNWAVLTAEASMPTHMRSTWTKKTCVSLANSNFCTSAYNGFISSIVNTSCLPNGSSTVSATTLDTAEKSGSNATSIVIKNGQPTTHSLKIKSNSPAWNSKSISGKVSLNASQACSYRIEVLDAKGKKVLERGSGEFDAKSQYDAAFYFTKLKPSTKYVARVFLTNSGGSTSRTQSFTTPRLPPKPQVSLVSKLCRPVTNVDTCIGRLRAYPSVVDCTFVRRSWIWNASSWWIIGFSRGAAVISQSPFGCV